MFDSYEAILAAQRQDNRSRARRARLLAEAPKIPVPVDEILTSAFLLEAWMYAVSAGMSEALRKDPTLSMRAAAVIAITQDSENSPVRKSKKN
jgi:hypothetical protein